LLIHGTKGELRQKLNDPRGVTIFQEITGKAYEFYLSSDPSYTPMDEFRLQLEAFLDAITTVENRSVSPEEAYKVLRVVEAAYNQRSMMDQPWVHVKTIFKVSDG
jgi:predicted dehydrogenase